jgi:hypothetical protein
MIRKILVATLAVASVAYADLSLTSMVCLSDTSGREVRLYGPDTSVTYQDVIRVIYRTGGFLVSFKNGDSLSLDRPPFFKSDATPKGEETPAKPKAESKKDDGHKGKK